MRKLVEKLVLDKYLTWWDMEQALNSYRIWELKPPRILPHSYNTQAQHIVLLWKSTSVPWKCSASVSASPVSNSVPRTQNVQWWIKEQRNEWEQMKWTASFQWVTFPTLWIYYTNITILLTAMLRYNCYTKNNYTYTWRNCLTDEFELMHTPVKPSPQSR